MSGRRISAIVPLVLCVMGCADRGAPVRIGVKDFTEQTVLGEMMATVLRQAGHEVAPLVRCVDTWGCHRALREGRIDVLVEYTGTGLAYAGARAGETTLARVRELYAPLGIEWRVPLGFDNGYRVLRPANAAGPAEIGALARRGGLRFAVPEEYLRRPRDGLPALLSRYGLAQAGAPIVIDDPAARYEAMRTGRADVAIGYATDGAIDELGLTPLADPAGFFPPYEAVIVVRAAASAQHPRLGEALDGLAGRIDTETMRGLNARVSVEGRNPRSVARGFLVGAELVDADAVTVESGPELVLGRPSGALEAHVPRARRAVRAAFPDRPVRVEAHRAPKERLTTGDARVALMGAEQLFRWSVRRRRWVRDDRVEALAVLDERRMHLVRRADDSAGALAGALGIEAGSAGRAAKAMLDAMGQRRARADGAAALLAAVKAGALNGALIFAEPGHPALTEALASGGLALRGLDGWLTTERAARLPFLRISRLPSGTYAGQDQPVETVGAQVVLADAAPGGPSSHGGGPVSALPTGGAPLAPEQVRALIDALGVTETPDPALPNARHRTELNRAPEPAGWRSALDVALNGLIALFTGWLGWLLLGPSNRERPVGRGQG